MKKIKGFTKYEADLKTGEVRNIETKKSQTIKKGTGKFYLTNNEGQKKLIALDKMEFIEDKNLIKKVIKLVSDLAPIVPKKEKPTFRTEKELLLNAEIKGIVNNIDSPKHLKCYQLHLSTNISNTEIASLLGMSKGNVSRDLWGYKTGRYKIA